MSTSSANCCKRCQIRKRKKFPMIVAKTMNDDTPASSFNQAHDADLQGYATPTATSSRSSANSGRRFKRSMSSENCLSEHNERRSIAVLFAEHARKYPERTLSCDLLHLNTEDSLREQNRCWNPAESAKTNDSCGTKPSIDKTKRCNVNDIIYENSSLDQQVLPKICKSSKGSNQVVYDTPRYVYPVDSRSVDMYPVKEPLHNHYSDDPVASCTDHYIHPVASASPYVQPECTKRSRILADWFQNRNRTNRNIRDYTAEVLRRHQEERVFVRTQAYQAVVNKIEDGNNIIVVTGGPGYGLTSTGREVLSDYSSVGRNGKRFIPLIMHYPFEWYKCVSIKENTIVLLDDVFGVKEFELETFNSWQRILRDAVATRNVILLITMNKSVFEEMAGLPDIRCIINGESLVDMSSSQYQLTDREKKNILRQHLVKASSVLKGYSSEIRLQTVHDFLLHVDLSQATFGFPKYAQSFAASGNDLESLTTYLDRPLLFHYEEIERMRKSSCLKENLKYMALISVYVSNNELDLFDFENTFSAERRCRIACGSSLELSKASGKRHCKNQSMKTAKQFLTATASYLHLDHMSCSMIKQGANNLIGTLLKTGDGTSFQFAGLSTRRCVETSFANINPVFVIKNANILHLLECARPKSMTLNIKTIATLDIEEKDIEALSAMVTRFVNAARDGYVQEVVCHPLMTQDFFTAVLFCKMKNRRAMVELASSKDKSSKNSFVYHCLEMRLPFVFRVLHMSKWKKITSRVPSTVSDKQRQIWVDAQNHKMLVKASELGDFNVFSYLKDCVCKEKADTNMFLKHACIGNHEEIIHIIFSTWTFNMESIAQAIFNTWIYFHSDCVNDLGKICRITDFLLSKFGSINERISNEIGTLLHEACYINKKYLVKKLVDAGADINNTNAPCGESPLHITARMSDTSLLEFFLGQGALCDIRDDYGRLPIFGSAACGRYQATKRLLEHGSPVHQSDCQGVSPLDIALERGNYSVLYLLQTYKSELDYATYL